MNTPKNNKIKKYDSKTKAVKAIISVFPTIETFNCFKDSGDNKIIQTDLLMIFIRFAYQHNLISEKTETAFQELIEKKQMNSIDKNSVHYINFEYLIHDKLKLKSGRQFIRKINDVLKKELSENKALKISISSLTRLKESPPDTITKRNALRFIAFWIGFEYPELVELFNYEKLILMCPKIKKIKSQEGVRILFYLIERGEDITEQVIKWFKLELRTILDDLKINYSTINSHKNLKRTELSIDLPIISKTVSHPGAFGRCIRDAIAIAHQMSVRWTLSAYNSKRKALFIGISTGEFINMHHYLQSLVMTSIPGEPIIRMTDFTRFCSMANNVRIIMNKTPQKTKIHTGEIMNIWWVEELWSTIHWDFIPVLLQNEMLPDNESSYNALNKLLWNPDDNILDKKGLKAILTLYKFPQNSLLGIEIAKVLYFRGRFVEANEVLKLVLNAEPYQLTARSLRMRILFESGHLDFLPYSISDFYFQIAEEEANFITDNCILDEDFYCEYVEGYLKKALRLLRLMKHCGKYDKKTNQKVFITDKKESFSKLHIYSLLDHTENMIIKGITCSSTGYRAIYYLTCIRCLRGTLQDNEIFFLNDEISLYDKNNICKKITQEMFFSLGWLSSLSPETSHLDDLFNRLIYSVSKYEDSEQLRSQQPSTKLVYAILLWDFYPRLTFKIAKQVIKCLNDAIDLAKSIEKDNIGITALIRLTADTLPSHLFIYYVNQIIKKIEEKIGTLDELSDVDENESLENKVGGLRILFLFVGEMIQFEQYVS